MWRRRPEVAYGLNSAASMSETTPIPVPFRKKKPFERFAHWFGSKGRWLTELHRCKAVRGAEERPELVHFCVDRYGFQAASAIEKMG